MKNAFEEIIEGEQPVLVDFSAEWCGPCKMMKPVLDELKKRVGNRARILKIDIDRNPGISGNFQIQSVPTLILFKNGRPVWRRSGVFSAADLEQIILSH